ncbi:MAG: NAD(P)-dependent oxidoreductase [Trueperaceae bacterium]|nr:NAD(P)-dependent oxidoreductase [Trueperaceae bacterium]
MRPRQRRFPAYRQTRPHRQRRRRHRPRRQRRGQTRLRERAHCRVYRLRADGRTDGAQPRRGGAVGFPLVVYNRTRAKAEAFQQDTGATVADTPADLARRVDVIFTMLADDAAVEAVYHGDNGLLQGVRRDQTAIDMSTVAPTTVRTLASALAERGAALLDAPVSGSTDAATNATLMVMVGGDAGVLERVRGVLEPLARTLIHVGPSGSGAAMKLAVNTMIHSLNEAVSEALILAERSGIGLSTAYDVIAQSAAAAPMLHYRRHLYEQPDQPDISFALRLAQKDVRLALELGQRVGAPLPQAERTYDLLEAASAAGFAERDMASIISYLRDHHSAHEQKREQENTP